mgnify:CR=1 FL=1
MQQIADRVGVSKFAVSQALSGKPGVAEETRMRIVQAANEMGYSRTAKPPAAPKDKTAGAKPKGRASAGKNTVIILMPNVRFQSRESLFWGKIIDGAAAALTEREVGVMMVTESYSERSLRSVNPDGVLGLIGIGYIASQVLLDIRHAGIPFVLVDHEDPLVPSDTVFMNNYDSMKQMTSLLLEAGLCDLRFVGSPAYSRSFLDRWLGFRMALEEAGLRAPAREEDPFLQMDEDAYLVVDREIPRLVQQRKLPEAFVCANDFFAYLVLKLLAASGVNVPGDVAVTGFDHTDEEQDPGLPALSTIHVPKETLGRRAVEMLFARLEEPDRSFEKTMIHGSLLLRESFRKD